MPRRARRAGASLVTSRPSKRIRPAVGSQRAGDQVEQRGLAGAVGADQPEPVAGRHPQVDPVQGGEVTVPAAETVDQQQVTHVPTAFLAGHGAGGRRR